MSKKFPDLRSDEEADAWLQGADLTEYDLSGMKKVRFELARKDASISLRLPAALLATLKANAARANMPTQRLIRMMIEAQLGQAGAKPKRKSALPRGQETARLDSGICEAAALVPLSAFSSLQPFSAQAPVPIHRIAAMGRERSGLAEREPSVASPLSSIP